MAEVGVVQVGVVAALGHQRVVRALLDYLAVGHHYDAVVAFSQPGGSAPVRGDLSGTIRLEQHKTGRARSNFARPAAFFGGGVSRDRADYPRAGLQPRRPR
jgi:hypothetical protein